MFSFVTSDTHFSWALLYPGSRAEVNGPPVTIGPSADASQTVTLDPGKTAEAHFAIGVGVEGFSAMQSARALTETIDREGSDKVLDDAETWLSKRTRTTGRADLDMLMNRNFLFTRMYAWGESLDTEQVVGITRAARGTTVSAAYWDRDAMLWSFPGLLDTDRDMARSALEYALTVQLRNTGTHSRFIDGIVLEDGLELDEADAPWSRSILISNEPAILRLSSSGVQTWISCAGLLENFDPQLGLYITLQDAQDEYRKQGFSTYDNVLTWRTLKDLGDMYATGRRGFEPRDGVEGGRVACNHPEDLRDFGCARRGWADLRLGNRREDSNSRRCPARIIAEAPLSGVRSPRRSNVRAHLSLASLAELRVVVQRPAVRPAWIVPAAVYDFVERGGPSAA